ncbi:hypothetical protein E4U22_007075 [Claviceps purpurea]|nr:hypothetical protein E4U10_001725 [Claviceps purpurea]KAG6211760.1 hypothetical protein E4U35_001864 [Claviceps purpurea]KAG6250717.1 hypothetical protein E4U23_001257 [Claviceps purpurea]KAG6306523.1 hypothetical protein E4U45_006941 [Claviceps purpurea]KAG6316435.1 hypothetical protein E4U22_007075 [Claviceps purpurea]
MRVSISALLLAATAMAAPAPAPATVSEPMTHETCTQKSGRTRGWQVKDFDFHASYLFTTPAHQNSAGFVKFTLENPALNFTSQCEGRSGQLDDFFYGNFVYKCTQPVPGVETTFTFSRPSSQLLINQSWACVDEQSSWKAQGGANLTLDCKDETWKNPDWKQGQTYSSRTVSCGHVNAPIPINSMSAVA